MFNKISKLIVITVFGLIISGCANSDFAHKNFMKGQIISVDDNNIYVCVGVEDGAKVGQIFEAYRYILNDDNDEGAEFFHKQETGHIRIEELVDGHFAKVSVLEGEVQKNDIVLLNK